MSPEGGANLGAPRPYEHDRHGGGNRGLLDGDAPAGDAEVRRGFGAGEPVDLRGVAVIALPWVWAVLPLRWIGRRAIQPMLLDDGVKAEANAFTHPRQREPLAPALSTAVRKPLMFRAGFGRKPVESAQGTNH